MALADALVIGAASFMAIMGLIVLAAGPRRVPTVFFGLFMIVWSAEVVFVQASRLASPRIFLQLGIAAMLVEFMLLIHLVGALATDDPRVRRRTSYFLVPYVATIGSLFIAEPSAFATEEGFTPLGGLLIVFPSTAAFLVAIVAFANRLTRPLARTERIQLTILFGALSVFVGDLIGFFGMSYALDWAFYVGLQGMFLTLLYFGLFVAGAGVYIVLVSRSVHHLLKRSSPISMRSESALMLALAFPLLFGLLDALFAPTYPPWFVPAAYYRVLLAALIAYGLLKFHIFGLDLHLKKGLAMGFPVIVAMGVEIPFDFLTNTFQDTLPLWQQVFLAVGVFVVAGAAATPFRDKAADFVFPYVDDTDAYRRARALQVYQAALLPTMDRGGHDDPFLAKLRADLHISMTEHDRLLRDLEAEREGLHPEVGEVVAGRYRREFLLGEDIVASTWLANDTERDDRVVLKDLHDPAFGDKPPEASRLLGTQHPNLVTVRDVLVHDGRPVVAFEHVASKTLRESIEKDGAMPLDKALTVARAVLEGLVAMHGADVLHRNLKPANVLVGSGGQVKITDHGLTPILASRAERASTVVAAEQGSLAYASPEKVRGTTEDARADVHAVGAILYEMLAGRHYMELDMTDEYAMRKAIVQGTPDLPLPHVPQKVNDILDRSLARQKTLRYGSAKTMLDAVEDAMADLPERHDVTASTGSGTASTGTAPPDRGPSIPPGSAGTD